MHNRANIIQHSHLAERNRVSFIPPDQTACSARSTSSLADADRSQPSRERRLALLLLFSGPPKACLNGVVCPPLCASCCHLSLLSFERQFHEMTSGGLWCFGLPDDSLKKCIFLTCVRSAVRNHLVLFLRRFWSLQRVVLPVSMFPRHVIGLHLEWGFQLLLLRAWWNFLLLWMNGRLAC